MPRSRSRSFESMTRSCTCSCAAKVPDCCSSLSTSVVLPWSTWAMIAMLRRVRFMGPRIVRELSANCARNGRQIPYFLGKICPPQFPRIHPKSTAWTPHLLSKTAAAMVAKGKGILAADESAGTCETRFKSINVECTEENRRAYRGLLFTTPGIEQYLSGVILFDETLRQKTNDGVPFGDYLAKKGIIPGIKVDAGAKDLPLCAGREGHRGPRQPAQAPGRVLQARRALRQVARGDHHRQEHPDATPASTPTRTRSRATPPPARRPRSCR